MFKHVAHTWKQFLILSKLTFPLDSGIGDHFALLAKSRLPILVQCKCTHPYGFLAHSHSYPFFPSDAQYPWFVGDCRKDGTGLVASATSGFTVLLAHLPPPMQSEPPNTFLSRQMCLSNYTETFLRANCHHLINRDSIWITTRKFLYLITDLCWKAIPKSKKKHSTCHFCKTHLWPLKSSGWKN